MTTRAMTGVLLCAALGCGGTTKGPTGGGGMTGGGTTCAVKVGFISDTGGINDKGFNQAGWNGVLAAAGTLGLASSCYSYLTSNAETDYEPNLNKMVADGATVIVSSGFGMQKVTRKVGRENPSLFFIGVDHAQVDEMGRPDPIANVAGLVFHEDAAGFLAGALAGLTTTSGTVSQVEGCPIPPVARFGLGFYNGAKYVRADAKVLTTFHALDFMTCFNDPDWARARAMEHIGMGADVLFAAAGGTGTGYLEKGCEGGKKVIGVDFDQYDSLPKVQPCIVSSATKNMIDGVANIIVAVQRKTFKGGDIYGGVALAPFHSFEAMLSTEVKAQLKDIERKIAAGEIDPCKDAAGVLPSGVMPFCTPIR